MSSLSDAMKDLLVELCLQRQLQDDLCPTAESIDATPRYLRNIKAMMCEALLWDKHKQKASELAQYLDVKPNVSVPDISGEGLLIVENTRAYLNARHRLELSYDDALLQPMDVLLEVGQLAVLSDLVREQGRRIQATLSVDAVNPETPTHVKDLWKKIDEIVNLYKKKLFALDIRGSHKKLNSYMESIENLRSDAGKYSASLSVSRSLSSSSLGDDSENFYEDIERLQVQQEKQSSNALELLQLNAYLSYLWVQATLNGCGYLGVEGLSSDQFRGSLLERDLLVVLRFDASAVCCFCMIVANALSGCENDLVYTVNPLESPFKKFLVNVAQYEVTVDRSVDRIRANVEEELNTSIVLDPRLERMLRDVLWLMTACKVAKQTWTERMNKPGMAAQDVRLHSACLRALEGFDADSKTRLLGVREKILSVNRPGAFRSEPRAIAFANITPRERAASSPPSAISTSDDSDEENENAAFEVGSPILYKPWISPARGRERNVSLPFQSHASPKVIMGNRSRPGSERARPRIQTDTPSHNKRLPSWISQKGH